MRVRHFFILCMLAALSGCSSVKQDHTAGWSAAQLYEAGKADMQGGSYLSATDYYTKLLSRFPYGQTAQQSQLDLAYVHYKSGDADEALAQLDSFIRTYPQHPYIDYALFLKGVVEYERNVSLFDRLLPTNLSQTDPEALKKAFDSFKRLTDEHPDSEYAEDARYRMLFIRNLLGENTLEVANYYLRRGAYVAAAARARQVLEEYEQTPSAPYALAIMSRAYREMGETVLADDVLRILEQNFPDKMQDQEIRTTLQGDISSQRSFWERIGGKPKI